MRDIDSVKKYLLNVFYKGFNDTYCCVYLLSPIDPEFQTVAKAYVQVQTQEFGTGTRKVKAKQLNVYLNFFKITSTMWTRSTKWYKVTARIYLCVCSPISSKNPASSDPTYLAEASGAVLKVPPSLLLLLYRNEILISRDCKLGIPTRFG